MSDEAKFRIITRLLNGDTPLDIARDEKIPYPTVLRYRRELKEAQETDSVHTLMNLEKSILQELIGKVKIDAETSPLKPVLHTVLERVEVNLGALANLSDEFQQTAQVLNNRIRLATAEIVHVSEIEVLTDALCKLQNAFFNKNSTQVNVQNNYDSTGNHRYSNWLSDKPTNTIQTEQPENIGRDI